MKAIFGLDDVSLTDEDGSPTGKKEFLCWNCPLIDPSDRGSGRLSPINETSRMLVYLIKRGVRTIVFCKVRKLCDILLRAVRTELRHQNLEEFTTRVMSYRGGYTAQDRRKIEEAMFNGDLLGIIATTALELGVDIGSLGSSPAHLYIMNSNYRCSPHCWVPIHHLCSGMFQLDIKG
jgi:DEAD/DEAH box helicase domain-containing protein